MTFDDIYTMFNMASYNGHYNYRFFKTARYFFEKQNPGLCNCTPLDLLEGAHDCVTSHVT